MELWYLISNEKYNIMGLVRQHQQMYLTCGLVFQQKFSLTFLFLFWSSQTVDKRFSIPSHVSGHLVICSLSILSVVWGLFFFIASLSFICFLRLLDIKEWRYFMNTIAKFMHSNPKCVFRLNEGSAQNVYARVSDF